MAMINEGQAPEKVDVPIFINRIAVEAPTPLRGHKLYELGNIPAHQQLFREASGTAEDEPIANDAERIFLKSGDHFYSEREFKLVINGQQKVVAGPTVTYEEIVRIAFPVPTTGPNVLYTVTFADGPRKNPEGELLPHKTVQIKNGMTFHVTPTDKS